jgi:hypothetical protein
MRTNEAVRLSLTVLAAATLLGASSPAASPPAPSPPAAASPASLAETPDADAIFDAARKAWGRGAYPRYAEYVAVVSYHKGTRFVRRSWETTEDLRQGLIYSRGFSREEAAHPYVPHGINVSIIGFGNLNPVQPDDPIGHVSFAIDQDFGLAARARPLASVTNWSTVEARSSALPVIGRTGTIARDYDVRLVETAVDEIGPEYHLALTPLRDPVHHRLRELWVDGKTSLPEEAVVEGIGSRPPLTKVRWRVEYRQTEGATYIARETALAPLDYGKAGTLRDVTVAYEEVKLTSRPSPYRFGFSMDDPQGEP